MPPKKRKVPSGKLSNEPPRKRKAGSGEEGDAPIDAPEEDHAPPTEEPSEKLRVRWVLPKAGATRLKVRQVQDTFAPVLFQRPWEELLIEKTTPFGPPPLPSPLHKAAQGRSFQNNKAKLFNSRKIPQELREFHDHVWKNNKKYLKKAERVPEGDEHDGGNDNEYGEKALEADEHDEDDEDDEDTNNGLLGFQFDGAVNLEGDSDGVLTV